MTDLTHRDLDLKLDKLETKTDEQHAELLRELGELKVLVATSTSAHGTQLKAHETRIGKIEDRSWLTVVGAAGGTISILASIGLALLVALL